MAKGSNMGVPGDPAEPPSTPFPLQSLQNPSPPPAPGVLVRLRKEPVRPRKEPVRPRKEPVRPHRPLFLS